jgi:uncharacterized membrane protein YoaK (UPF0700 family)
MNNYFGDITDISSDQSSNLDPAITLSIILFSLAFTLILYAVYAWLLGRVFAKAGISKAIAWIPFYSNWKLLELGDQQGFWAVLTIIPIVSYVSLVFTYIAMYRIGLKLGKEGWWVVLAIFVPIVWIAILAFDKSTWHPNILNQQPVQTPQV